MNTYIHKRKSVVLSLEEGLLFLLLISYLLCTTMAAQKELQAVVQGNGIFTKNLYQVLSQSKNNVFFSPISVHAVLSMAYQGAKGNTQTAFANTLNVSDSCIAAEGYRQVMELLNNVPDVKLHLANKIFIKDGYNLQNNFKDAIAKGFHSEVQSTDFEQNQKAADIINTWVEEKTEKKIKDLISADALDSLTRLVLVNAIYFKGNWAQKFDERNTQKEKFYLNAADTVEVDMMNLYGKKFFYKDDEELDAKIIDLPYTNPNLSLIVILPNKIDGIGELEQKLNGKDFTQLTKEMYKADVNLKLPKFKIETTIDLNDALSKMGLHLMFDQSKADFSGMIDSKEQLYVSQVIQKAFIEVNEEGSEAAAATGMVMQARSGFSRSLIFHANHPFIIILLSKSPQSLPIFYGKLADSRFSGTNLPSNRPLTKK